MLASLPTCVGVHGTKEPCQIQTNDHAALNCMACSSVSLRQINPSLSLSVAASPLFQHTALCLLWKCGSTAEGDFGLSNLPASTPPHPTCLRDHQPLCSLCILHLSNSLTDKLLFGGACGLWPCPPPLLLIILRRLLLLMAWNAITRGWPYT